MSISPEVKNFYMTFKALIKAYPHIVIWLAGLGVLVAARFGYHVSTDQVVAIAGAVITAATAIVHMSMTANPHVATVAKAAVLTETMVPVVEAVAPVVEQPAPVVEPVTPEVEPVEQPAPLVPEVERGHVTDPVIGPGAPVKHP